MYAMISYDIGSDKRRQKMHDLLKNYGTWMQYSVFECRLTEPQFKTLRKRMNALITDDEAVSGDNIRIYQMCGECVSQIEHFGVRGKMVAEDHIHLI
jgi:CRISPR-associated protein Cas2